jgi:hypothetical protein
MLNDETDTQFLLRQARMSERDYRDALKRSKLFRESGWKGAADRSAQFAKQCRAWVRYWRAWATTGVQPDKMP